MDIYDGWPFPRITPEGRECTKCQTWKPAGMFSKLPTGAFRSHCKPCFATYIRDRYHNDQGIRERSNKRGREWASANRKRISEIRRRNHTEKLSDSYVRKQLSDQDLPTTPDFVEVKRLQLQLHRTMKNGSASE